MRLLGQRWVMAARGPYMEPVTHTRGLHLSLLTVTTAHHSKASAVSCQAPSIPTTSPSPVLSGGDAGICRELTRPHRSGSPGQILCSRSLESKSDMGTFRQAPATSPVLPFPPLPVEPRSTAQHSMQKSYWEDCLRRAELWGKVPHQSPAPATPVLPHQHKTETAQTCDTPRLHPSLH